MGLVTDGAVLLHRLVLKDERPFLFAVAVGAKLVDPPFHRQCPGVCPVHIVAGGAAHAPLADRVVRGGQGLGPHVLVAAGTAFGGLFRSVDPVAGGAGSLLPVDRGGESCEPLPAVAAQAGLGVLLAVLVEPHHPGQLPGFPVPRYLAVAGGAAHGTVGGLEPGDAAMHVLGELFHHSFVTRSARLRALPLGRESHPWGEGEGEQAYRGYRSHKSSLGLSLVSPGARAKLALEGCGRNRGTRHSSALPPKAPDPGAWSSLSAGATTSRHEM